jgi:hypothetical protein
MNNECVNILCLKWGKAYGPEYVNQLYRGVKNNIHRQFRFVCVTDNADGLDEGIDAQPFPVAPTGWKYSWPNIFVKLMVFKDGFANLKGPTLFLDIDQIIVGKMDDFFDFKSGEFCIIRNWIELRKRIFRGLPKIGNSSCFRFEAGKMNYVYEKFVAEMDIAVQQKFFRTEQAYMTHAVGLKNVNWWPSAWVQSFKRSCMRIFPFNLFMQPKQAKNAKILCFHGRPTPDDAINGYKGKHLNTWVKPCLWVKELWKKY